jgi:hypothetical protein
MIEAGAPSTEESQDWTELSCPPHRGSHGRSIRAPAQCRGRKAKAALQDGELERDQGQYRGRSPIALEALTL